MGFYSNMPVTSAAREQKTAYPRMSTVVAGYRDYSPEIGRWNSRDSIEEDGGLLLYGFVGNEPVGRMDNLGFASYDFIPDQIVNAPYSYDSLGYKVTHGQRRKVLGEVRDRFFAVICACDCRADDAEYEMNCVVFLWIDIYLDEWYRSHETFNNVHKRKVYGHEQKHIESMQSIVLSDVVPSVERKENIGPFPTHDECRRHADSAETSGTDALNSFWLSEALHINPGSPTEFERIDPYGGYMP